MTDVATNYNTGDPLPLTLDTFSKRKCARACDNGYEPPTPEEVNQLIKLAGWSQNDAANIVGVKCDSKKGSSTIRKWKSDKSKRDHREIPYSAWRLMLLTAGVVSLHEKI